MADLNIYNISLCDLHWRFCSEQSRFRSPLRKRFYLVLFPALSNMLKFSASLNARDVLRFIDLSVTPKFTRGR